MAAPKAKAGMEGAGQGVACARGTIWLLVAVHLFLAVWALVGFVELAVSAPPWTPISNPRFPTWMLAAQWGSTLATACLFLYGVATGWRALPVAMTVGYGAMAIVCGIQNVSGMLVRETHYLEMAVEYVVYAAILWLLFRSKAIRRQLRIS